jgi:hypothetical protein
MGKEESKEFNERSQELESRSQEVERASNWRGAALERV